MTSRARRPLAVVGIGVLGLALVALVLWPPSGKRVPSATASTLTTPEPTLSSPSVPIKHIIWVWLENHRAGAITPVSMPYLTGLASTYGHAANYYAIGHNSELNYVAAVSGQHGGVTDGTSGIVFPSLWDQLAGNWRAYQQDIGANGCTQAATIRGPFDGPGLLGTYVQRHNPAIVFADVAHGLCRGHIFPLARFDPAVAAFTFVTPNLTNDAHDGTLAQADAFLRGFVPEVIRSPDFTQTMLVITFDEGTTTTGANGDSGGRVYTVVVAPWLHGLTSTRYYDHYSLLRTVESVFGLPRLGHACDHPAMSDFLP